MKYEGVQLASYVDRPSRFTCRVELNGAVVDTHLKNTGRGAEVLIPNATVAVVPAKNPDRKTYWDLVAIVKETAHGRFWINVDSSAPNQVTKEAVTAGRLVLPELEGDIMAFQPEVTFGDSRVDFKGVTTTGREFFVETKGCTLENEGIVGFPDAPSVRAVKHVVNLAAAVAAGYQAYLLFVIQMDNVDVMTLNKTMAPKLTAAIREAETAGVHVLAYCSTVDEHGITLHRPTTFDIDAPFTNPQLKS
ncbi:DNA/RNA nuclease SfsA [Furfurilactobacillus entadae]|uniref:DNA/RNA nuclease SfsA n=1 Tax=Furfurilactobacillus entadae TaxID=2922307 RepID=UPI0035E5A47C